MRLWSLHPKYLDPQGLVALWREALLARAVLRGETVGYRQHPQLTRFRQQPVPRDAIDAYLAGVFAEAQVRGYAFDARKLGRTREHAPIPVGAGQLALEWQHLLDKLASRNPALHERWRNDAAAPDCHSLFLVRPGAVEAWERQRTPLHHAIAKRSA
jgi:hypothetical protein